MIKIKQSLLVLILRELSLELKDMILVRFKTRINPKILPINKKNSLTLSLFRNQGGIKAKEMEMPQSKDKQKKNILWNTSTGIHMSLS